MLIKPQYSIVPTTTGSFVARLFKMKVSLALCLAICIVGVYCDEQKVPKLAERLKDNPHIKECTDESKVDQKILDDMRNNYKLPDHAELKCFLGCMLRKEGVMLDDGKFTDKMTDADCKSKGGNGACGIAYNAMKCLLEKDLAALNKS